MGQVDWSEALRAIPANTRLLIFQPDAKTEMDEVLAMSNILTEIKQETGIPVMMVPPGWTVSQYCTPDTEEGQ